MQTYSCKKSNGMLKHGSFISYIMDGDMPLKLGKVRCRGIAPLANRARQMQRFPNPSQDSLPQHSRPELYYTATALYPQFQHIPSLNG